MPPHDGASCSRDSAIFSNKAAFCTYAPRPPQTAAWCQGAPGAWEPCGSATRARQPLSVFADPGLQQSPPPVCQSPAFSMQSLQHALPHTHGTSLQANTATTARAGRQHMGRPSWSARRQHIRPTTSSGPRRWLRSASYSGRRFPAPTRRRRREYRATFRPPRLATTCQPRQRPSCWW